jgi:hypothetical protein
MRVRILISLLGAIVIALVVAESWPFTEDSSDPWPRSQGLVVDFAEYSETNAMITVKNLSRGRVQLEPWVQVDYLDGHAEAFRFANTNLPSRGALAISIPAPTNHIAWKAGVVGHRPWERGFDRLLNSTELLRRLRLDPVRCGWTQWQNPH